MTGIHVEVSLKFESGGWFELGIAEYCSGSGNKNASINHFERARNDRDWRKMAEYEIDRVRNPEKYEQ